MIAYADASFLVAYYVKSDRNHSRAERWLKNFAQPIAVSRLTLFETENAIRTLVLSRELTLSDSHRAFARIELDRSLGLLQRREMRNHRVFPAAQRLSQFHSAHRCYGALEILHVAVAVDVGAEVLLSFDERQKQLVVAVGMRISP